MCEIGVCVCACVLAVCVCVCVDEGYRCYSGWLASLVTKPCDISINSCMCACVCISGVCVCVWIKDIDVTVGGLRRRSPNHVT